MDRPRRVTKVTNYRKFHLSGDLEEEVVGLVDTRVSQFEMAKSQEELQKQLEQEKQNKRMLEEMELAKIESELEAERMKRQELQVAMQQLKEAREHATQEHDKCIENMKRIASEARTQSSQSTMDWFKEQISTINKDTSHTHTPEEESRKAEIKELKAQQEDISKRLAELESSPETVQSDNPLLEAIKHMGQPGQASGPSQELLLQQLKTALAGKEEEDPNKALLKALLTAQNRTPGEGGTNTLRTSLMQKISRPESDNSMADWLASLNRQEEVESNIPRIPFMGEDEGSAKHGKARSGILDKATTNIQQKQVWPQQNLGEDWADEDIEFKQIKFEHMVAGESRTIETCTDPAEILGRLRLLRRLAYLKL